MDLLFLFAMIIDYGICFGIKKDAGCPLWYEIANPFFTMPIFYMIRFCTIYMIIVVSIERHNAISDSFDHISRPRIYICLVVVFSGKIMLIFWEYSNTWRYAPPRYAVPAVTPLCLRLQLNR